MIEIHCNVDAGGIMSTKKDEIKKVDGRCPTEKVDLDEQLSDGDLEQISAAGTLYRNFGTSGDDSMVGTIGNERMMGFEGDDTIYSGDGRDWIDGNEGDDSLNSGAGEDVIFAGSGNDTLIGGDGNDKLVGGLGADVYKFDGSDGNDTVYGFAPHEDRLEFTGSGNLTMDNFEVLNGATIITYGNTTVRLEGKMLSDEQMQEIIDSQNPSANVGLY